MNACYAYDSGKDLTNSEVNEEIYDEFVPRTELWGIHGQRLQNRGHRLEKGLGGEQCSYFHF